MKFITAMQGIGAMKGEQEADDVVVVLANPDLIPAGIVLVSEFLQTLQNIGFEAQAVAAFLCIDLAWR